MKYMFVSLSNPNWNAHTPDMMKKLGVVGSKWPDAGIAPQMVDGIKVWVKPRNPRPMAGEHKSNTMRVMCECPGCGFELSAGRLHQHKCVRAHNPRKRRRPLAQQLDRMRRALVNYKEPVAQVVMDAITCALKELS